MPGPSLLSQAQTAAQAQRDLPEQQRTSQSATAMGGGTAITSRHSLVGVRPAFRKCPPLPPRGFQGQESELAETVRTLAAQVQSVTQMMYGSKGGGKGQNTPGWTHQFMSGVTSHGGAPGNWHPAVPPMEHPMHDCGLEMCVGLKVDARSPKIPSAIGFVGNRGDRWP